MHSQDSHLSISLFNWFLPCVELANFDLDVMASCESPFIKKGICFCMAFLKFPSFKLCLALNALFVGPVHKAMLVCYVYGDPIKTNCNCILSTGTHVNINISSVDCTP